MPVDKWEQYYPDKPLPGPEDQGEEIIRGVATKCAYTIKPGCKADHYNVKRKTATRIRHTTRQAVVQEGDHERLSETLRSTQAKAADKLNERVVCICRV